MKYKLNMKITQKGHSFITNEKQAMATYRREYREKKQHSRRQKSLFS